jgi:hypothetical protein
MMRVEENFKRWRVKVLIYILIGFFFLVGLVRQGCAYSWAEVEEGYDELYSAYTTSTCDVWMEEIITGTGSLTSKRYRIWNRCDATETVWLKLEVIKYPGENCYYSDCHYDLGACQTTTACDGANGTYTPCNSRVYQAHGRQTTMSDCQGKTTVAQTYEGLATVKNLPCYVTHTDYSPNCAAHDTLLADYYPITDSCTPPSLTVSSVMNSGPTSGVDVTGAYSWTHGTIYYYFDQSQTGHCSCHPDGTRFVGSMPEFCGTDEDTYKGNSNNNPACNYHICYFESLVGSPDGGTNPPPTGSDGGDDTGGVGGGGNGGTDVGEGTGTEIIETTTGSDGTTTTTTVVTENTGTTTTTTTTEVVTTVSGSVTTTQTYTTETSVTYPDPGEVTPYSNNSIDEGGSKSFNDFNQLISTFFEDVKDTDLVRNFTLDGMLPSSNGATSSNVFTVEGGRYGTHTVDISTSNYASAYRIIHGFVLLIAGFLAVRAVVMRR